MSLEKTWHEWNKAILPELSHTLIPVAPAFLRLGPHSECAADEHQQMESAFISLVRAYIPVKLY